HRQTQGADRHTLLSPPNRQWLRPKTLPSERGLAGRQIQTGTLKQKQRGTDASRHRPWSCRLKPVQVHFLTRQ
ncbi:MAG: hypothetical protein ACKPKO_24440, partial [Candidatus Fonsibacter sp.]